MKEILRCHMTEIELATTLLIFMNYLINKHKLKVFNVQCDL